MSNMHDGVSYLPGTQSIYNLSPRVCGIGIEFHRVSIWALSRDILEPARQLPFFHQGGNRYFHTAIASVALVCDTKGRGSDHQPSKHEVGETDRSADTRRKVKSFSPPSAQTPRDRPARGELLVPSIAAATSSGSISRANIGARGSGGERAG